MKKLGRILVREPKTCGLFIPMQEGLESGIYEIREDALGELSVVRIGKQHMPEGRYQALTVNELVGMPSAFMTTKELTE